MTTNTEIRKNEECRKCKRWDRAKHQVRVREVLQFVADKMEGRVTDAGYKPTVADFLKVLDAESEFVPPPQQGPKEIHVVWADPTELSKN